jgi:hypothetical protein
MAGTLSEVIKELIEFIREASAIIHYFSDVVVIIAIYNIIFEQGTGVMVIIWVITALISAFIAELLKAHIPTPLRIVFRRKSIL